MVKLNDHLDLVFHALSDQTRRAIFKRVARRELTVTEIATPFEMSLPAVSKHIVVLERAGLVQRRKRGCEHRIRICAGPLKKASTWIEAYRDFWEERFDGLEKLLNEH